MCLAIGEVCSQNVTFMFSDGIDNESLKTKVEKNLSLFLTNINKAYRQKADKVDLSGVQIIAQAKEAFDDLWLYFPFESQDVEIVQSCIHSKTEYCVREIPVYVIDKDTLAASSIRELTIGFNSGGQITNVAFALEQLQVSTILQSGKQVKDVEERTQILNFVERYRSYYDQKDAKSIEEIFTDDAIIITGTVGMKKTHEGGMMRTVKYDKMNKQQYINKLKGIFARKSYIRVKFEKIDVIAHPTRDDIYMVRLYQHWNSPGYNDYGYVTLLWQFPRDGGDPRIMVRTWQDEKIIKSGESKLFRLDDFKIY